MAASKETAAIHPFGLDEFELAPQMGADKGEHQTAIKFNSFPHFEQQTLG